MVERRTGTPPTLVRSSGPARDFSPRVNFQCRFFYGVRTPPCASACINICGHVKDPVVHVRVRLMKETLKHPSMHRRVGSATLSQLAFPWESNPNFAWGKSKWGNTVVKNTHKKTRAKKQILRTLTNNEDRFVLYCILCWN